VRYIDWDDGVRLLGWSGKHVQSNINAFEIGQFVFE